MKLVNKKLAEDILDAGKKEFLSKGFEKASMRNIAASLNVTTGAIYRYYKDKESLFDAIVKESADSLVKRYTEEQNDFAALPAEEQVNSLTEYSFESYNWMIDYIYDHYEAFKLIICCSNNTKYEHYIERLIEIEVKSSHNLIRNMKNLNLLKHEIDDNLIHIVVTTFFHGMFETVMHDISKDKAMIYIRQVKEFYTAGWLKILGLLHF